MPSNFVYTQATLDSLEEALSTERLANYLALAKGNREKAIELYLWNAQLSAALHISIHVLEVVVRNSIHRELSRPFGLEWYDNPACPIKATLKNMVQEVKDTLTAEGKQIVPPRIIAGLTMGFWVFLLSKRYETPLWRPFLYNAFPNAPKPFERSRARGALDQIRLIRNRIAHHEPILSKSPDKIHTLILDVVNWVSADAAVWLKYHSRFDDIWGNPPA